MNDREQLDREPGSPLKASRSDGPLLRALDSLGLTYLARAARTCFAEVRVLLLHWLGKAKARRYRHHRQLKVHFGCGSAIKAGWLNVDLSPRVDLSLDLRKKLPLASGSCSLTHSEHFLEHLDYPDDAMRFLRESFRVTEPGGRISVGVPDAGVVLLMYADSKRNAQTPPFQRQPWHPPWVEHWMDRVNFLFRLNYRYYTHKHRHAYDFDGLAAALAKAGFTGVRRREFDPNTDTESRKGSTLYVEAFRPDH